MLLPLLAALALADPPRADQIFVEEIARAEGQIFTEKVRLQVVVDEEESLLAAKNYEVFARIAEDELLARTMSDLAVARQSLATSRVSYGDKHPTVVAFEATIAGLEAEAQRQASAVIDAQHEKLRILDAQAARLAEERTRRENPSSSR